VVGTSVVRNNHSTRDFAEKTQPHANHYGNIPLYRLAKLPAASLRRRRAPRSWAGRTWEIGEWVGEVNESGSQVVDK